jgi:hypothetical protein
VADSVRTAVAEIEAPYGRKIRFDDVAYESGLNLLRVTIREGSRYTILEIDAATASAWAEILQTWSASSSRPIVAP